MLKCRATGTTRCPAFYGLLFMKPIVGTSNWVLDLNLSTGLVASLQVSEKDRRDFLGGKGLGIKLLHERMDPGIDPLGEKNMLALMMGVLMGTGAPGTGGFSALTKSPLTGLISHSECGGPFGMACKTAGFDGLLISGRAQAPVVIVIDKNNVCIDDGLPFWGLDSHETQKRLNPDGRAGVLTIGPAGENQVRIANAASGGRFFGRGGLGAVMGAKNLKAIVARGSAYKIVPHNRKLFARTEKKARSHNNRRTLKDEDTRDVDMGRHFPVNNFREGSPFLDDQAASIMFSHPGVLPDDRTDHTLEIESITMLGPNLGLFDLDRIFSFKEHCNRLGLDSLSAGAVLAWCMEAGEKGLIDTNLKFGLPTGIDAALEDMAYHRGGGNSMGKGTRSLSSRYGGKDFAIQVKGLEMLPIDPRDAWGQGLAFAVANGGDCHLPITMAALEVVSDLLDPHTTRAKARWVKFLEDFHEAINSLQIFPGTACANLQKSPIVKWAPRWLLRAVMQFWPAVAILLMDVGLYAKLWRSVTGLRMSRRQILKAGARIHVLERTMNVGEDISRKDDTLPNRFLNERRTGDDNEVTVPLQPMLDAYYRIRGYDLRGMPTSKICKRLGISLTRPIATDPRLANFKMASPGPRRMKRLYLLIMFWFVGRAMEAAFKVDPHVRQLFDLIPNGLTFALNVAPNGPAMVVAKDEKGKVRYLDTNINQRYIDLTLTIKNIDAAMLLFTFREAIVTAVARNRLIVLGDTNYASIVIRILERVEVYLLPKALASLSVRRYPDLSMIRKSVGRGLIYLRALAGI